MPDLTERLEQPHSSGQQLAGLGTGSAHYTAPQLGWRLVGLRRESRDFSMVLEAGKNQGQATRLETILSETVRRAGHREDKPLSCVTGPCGKQVSEEHFVRQVGSPELAVFISRSHTPPTPKAMWFPHLGALSPWGWLWRAQRAMIAGMTAEKVLQPSGMAGLKPVL